MAEFLPFFIILLAVLIFSEVFARLHIPWVVALVVGGVIIGPFGLEIFEPDSTMKLLGDIGLIFLMFMAGLEIRLSMLKELKKSVFVMTTLNGVIPFFVGFAIGIIFGFDMTASFLLGAIFISSSIAVIIPSLESNKLTETSLGRTIIASTMVLDVLSLVLLSFVLQTVTPISGLPIFWFYVFLFGILVFMRWSLPKIRWFFFTLSSQKKGIFEWELQEIFVILLGTVVLFELLGLHAIIAGFFAGLVLSESINSDVLKSKLRAIAYGFFIPIFFVVVGAETNIKLFSEAGTVLLATIAIVFGSIIVKFTSGWAAARISGFTSLQGVLVGGATIPQLSTTLAVAITALELNILDESIVASMVILSLVTTLVGPIIVRTAKGRLDMISSASENKVPELEYEKT